MLVILSVCLFSISDICLIFCFLSLRLKEDPGECVKIVAENFINNPVYLLHGIYFCTLHITADRFHCDAVCLFDIPFESFLIGFRTHTYRVIMALDRSSPVSTAKLTYC